MKVANPIRLAILLLAAVAFSQSQTFSSGSTGVDGALSFTTPGTVYFDPKALNIDADGDNIFHFTTINVGAGVNLVLSSRYISGPVYWLASGAVTISGGVLLDGEIGHKETAFTGERIPSAAGAGGYGGGMGGGPSIAPQPGNGPGGGAAGTANLGGGPGTFTGNQYLVPLVGGSGGGGNSVSCTTYGGGGGAGGGAILIASSISITLSGGGIYARGGGWGGGCGANGGGSGGAIRLVSNTVTSNCGNGCPNMRVNGPNNNYGRIRIEAFNTNMSGNNVSLEGSPFVVSLPFSLALPTTPPSSIRVTTINGIPINSNTFTFPDVTINTSSPVTVNVQAQYIPPGTIPKIYVIGESGPDQIINCSPLAGTLAQTTCSVPVTFVPGGSRGFVKATW